MLTGTTLLQALEAILHRGRVVLADIAVAIQVMELAESLGAEAVLVLGEGRWALMVEGFSQRRTRPPDEDGADWGLWGWLDGTPHSVPPSESVAKAHLALTHPHTKSVRCGKNCWNGFRGEW